MRSCSYPFPNAKLNNLSLKFKVFPDLFSFFFCLKVIYKDSEIYALFENSDITKLDINRLFRFLDKYTIENAVGVIETLICEETKASDDEVSVLDESVF